MAIVTAVANGVDNYASILAMFGGSPLEGRLTTQLNEYDRVLNLTITDQSRLFSILGGTYPFQADIRLETDEWPSEKEAVAERIKTAFAIATGYQPVVAITSAGEPAPDKPAAGITDSFGQLIANLAKLLNLTVNAVKWLVVALAVGLAVVIYWVASKPTRAKSLI